MNMKIITGTKAKEIDRYAIDILNIPSLDLMENASSKVSDYIISNFTTDKSVFVLSSVGNNGADGLCVAQKLIKAGFKVKATIFGCLEKASWEFLYQLSKLKEIGDSISYYKGELLPDADILVDALFGIGLHKTLRPDALEIVKKAGEKSYPNIISIDIPSGINSDTGEIMGASIKATTTITFGRNKTGLVTGDGPKFAGKILVEEIGIPNKLYED